VISEAQAKLILSLLEERREFSDEEVLARCSAADVDPDPAMLLIQQKAPYQHVGYFERGGVNEPVPMRGPYVDFLRKRLPIFIGSPGMAEALKLFIACYPTPLVLKYFLPFPEGIRP